jgi:hypothetical protein
MRTERWAFFFFFCLLISPLELHSAQEVRVFVETDEEGLVDTRSEALNMALQQGVFQEAEELLRGRLDDGRRSLLRNMLAAKASGYVLGYAEMGYESTEWGAVLLMEVRVNRQALRGFLQGLGVYYTLDQTVGYALETESLTPEDAAVVQDMEILSGLRQDGADSPVLRLTRIADEQWQGSLDFQGMVWLGQDQDLEQLWAALWSNYFTLDQIRQGFEDRLFLTTQGWGGTVDVLGFDQVLRGWDLLADAVEMVGVSLRPEGVEARWSVTTMDRSGLESRLISVLQDMNISFSIR